MNNTANPVTSICTVEELCGFGGVFFLLAFILARRIDHSLKDFPTTPQTNGLGTNYVFWFWRPNLIHLKIHYTHISTCRHYPSSPQHACTNVFVCPSMCSFSKCLIETHSVAKDWARNGFRGISNHVFCRRNIWVGSSPSLKPSFSVTSVTFLGGISRSSVFLPLARVGQSLGQ